MATMRAHAMALTSRTSSSASLKLPRQGAAAPASARGQRSSSTIRCYLYRGGESEGRGRKKRNEGVSGHAPPLKANRAFLCDPFCTVVEDSEGLPMLMCPVEPGDAAPELGPTFRYVEWDFSEEHGWGLVQSDR
jgi:hypothetical protein